MASRNSCVSILCSLSPISRYCIWFPDILWPWKYSSSSRCTTSQWRHSIASINLYKSRTWAFLSSSHCFPDVKYYDFQKCCDLENIDQGHDIHHSQWCQSMASIDLYKCHTWEFFASSHRFTDINMIAGPWRSQCMTFALTPLDGKYLTSNLMAILMFALSLTIVWDIR